jgi:hypothetical protein
LSEEKNRGYQIYIENENVLGSIELKKMITNKNIIILFILLLTKTANSQCAMCKAVVESGDADMAEGLNSGIIYLMAFPYILVGVAGYLLFRFWKKNKI